MARPHVPPPRPILYPLRELATAVKSVQELPNHRRRVIIDHQPLAGVTSSDLFWWFQNIGGTLEYRGETIDRYLVWHPFDHIRWTGIRLVRRVGGVKVFGLSHTWSRCDGHTHSVSVMEIGAVARAFRLVNRLLTRRVFTAEMADAWIVHNVEEGGLLEHLLPALRRSAE